MQKTCAKCPNLRFTGNSVNGLGFAHCKLTSHAVPQHTKPLDDTYTRWSSVFWRIPVHCPLPNHIVEKSARQQPMERWEQRQWLVPNERMKA